MPDTTTVDPLTVGPLLEPWQVPRFRPDGRFVGADRIRHWIRGVEVRGVKHTLPHVRTGYVVRTTEAAVDQFLAELLAAGFLPHMI